MQPDDDGWFDALRGKPSPDSAPETIRHAEAVRNALLKRNAELKVTDAELARLRAKLHAQGLLESRVGLRRSWYAMAAGLVLCTGIVLIAGNQFILQQEGSVEQLRGASPESPIAKVKIPADDAHLLSQRLRQLGMDVQVVTTPDGVRIEAYVPSQLEQEVNQLLSPYHTHVGANGHLLLEFRSQ